jgi:hypothetical protein
MMPASSSHAARGDRRRDDQKQDLGSFACEESEADERQETGHERHERAVDGAGKGHDESRAIQASRHR